MGHSSQRREAPGLCSATGQVPRVLTAPCVSGGEGARLTHFTQGETKAQSGKGTHTRSCRLWGQS